MQFAFTVYFNCPAAPGCFPLRLTAKRAVQSDPEIAFEVDLRPEGELVIVAADTPPPIESLDLVDDFIAVRVAHAGQFTALHHVHPLLFYMDAERLVEAE